MQKDINRIDSLLGSSDKMLTETERDRLIYRSADSRIRANNDTKVKKKLGDWLDGLQDAKLIFKHYPLEKIKKIVSDDDAFSLFELSMYAMAMCDFKPIIGEINAPANWKIVIDKNEFGEDVTKPANDVDIVRSAYLMVLLAKLEYLLNSARNPVAAVVRFKLSELGDSLEFSAFLKDNPELAEKYRKGYERLCAAGFELPIEPRK